MRFPTYAGSFYPSNRRVLEKTIENLIDQAERTCASQPAGKFLKALVLPHAGYKYSGLTAAYGFLAIDGNRYNKVILLGPDHRVGFQNCIVSGAKAWETPLMTTRVHEESARLLLHGDLFKTHDVYDSNEHFFEVVLPFLQYRIKSFEFIPVIMGQCDTDSQGSICFRAPY